MMLPMVKKFNDTFSRFDTIPDCHGRTDGRTELLYRYRTMHSWMLQCGYAW